MPVDIIIEPPRCPLCERRMILRAGWQCSLDGPLCPRPESEPIDLDSLLEAAS